MENVSLESPRKRVISMAWDDTKPIIPQLWRMSDEDYRKVIDGNPMVKGPSIMMFGGLFEKLTYSKWWHPLVVWVPLAMYLFWWSHHTGLFLSLVLFGLGWIFWTIIEYVLHRWVFHLNHWWKSWPKFLVGVRNVIHFMFHGIHHTYPGDPHRIVTPLALAALIDIPIYYGLRMFFGRWLVDPFVAGALVGYLFYDYTHFAYHIQSATPAWLSRTLWFKKMKQRHSAHHFRDEHVTFGVSVCYTDWLFGTTPTKPTMDL